MLVFQFILLLTLQTNKITQRNMNISGTINALRILYNPSLFLPSVTVSTFNDLPVPLPGGPVGSADEIKVVLLDKDNCFAAPHTNEVWPAYREQWERLRAAYPGDRLLIVSNTSGSSSDPSGEQARKLEAATGVRVAQHGGKKPGCYPAILAQLQRDGLVESGRQVAVVGDRLFTDIAMANLMGGHGFWIRDGVVPHTSVFTGFEKRFYDFMHSKK